MLRLEREGFALEPDVVVFNFYLANDYVDSMLDQVGLRLQERSHLFNALLLLVDPVV